MSWNSKEPVGTEEMSYGLNTIGRGVKLSQYSEDPGDYVSSKNNKPD